jgi:hypothetical protein
MPILDAVISASLIALVITNVAMWWEVKRISKRMEKT